MTAVSIVYVCLVITSLCYHHKQATGSGSKFVSSKTHNQMSILF